MTRWLMLAAATALLVQVCLASSGLLVGAAFRHVDNALQCGTPTRSITWTGTSRAEQRFQWCDLVASYATVTPTAHPTATAPPPTVTPTRAPTATVIVWPTVAPIPTQAPSATPDTRSPALYVLSLINGSRATFGITGLALDSAESQCAYAHSQHMAAVGYISHDQFPADICVPYFTAGENVGQAYAPVTAGLLYLHQQMMAEAGWTPGCQTSHKCNILYSGYSRVGIGVYVGGDGRVWLTEDFIN